MIRDMVRDFAESVLNLLVREDRDRRPHSRSGTFCEQTGLQEVPYLRNMEEIR